MKILIKDSTHTVSKQIKLMTDKGYVPIKKTAINKIL